jgi:phosphatidylinositol-3-phosphatase
MDAHAVAGPLPRNMAWQGKGRVPALCQRAVTAKRVRVLVLICLGLLAGCGHKAAPPPVHVAGACGRAGSPPARYDHVVWIVMENRSYSDAIGAPYIHGLATACGLATNFHAEAHPSLPNYVAMTSGSTQGIHDDAGPAQHPLTAPSIFSQLGGGWRALEDAMPSPCLRADSGRYAVRHNPAAYFANVASSCDAQDVRLGAAPDLSARFTFVTPDLCHDMHDCSTVAGDKWLAGFVPQILRSSEYAAGRTAVFLTWDEDDGSASNHILTVVIAPHVRPGTRSAAAFDHYSLLRTSEDLLGLPAKLGAAARAPSMRPAFGL